MPLRGKLILNVTRALPDAQIILNLSGREKTRIRRQSGKNTHTYHGKRTICEAKAILKHESAGGMIVPGTYTYPFEFIMPDSIPSSMDGSRGYDNWMIQYKLTASAFAQRKLHDNLMKFYFSVASKPLPDVRVPAVVEPILLPIQSFGMGRGNLAITASVDDAHVGRGTIVNIRLATRNIATASIYRVEICLEEAVTWNAQSRRTDVKRTMSTLDNVDVPGIIRGKLDKDEAQALRDDRTALGDQLRTLHDELSSDQNIVKFKIPESCRDSYNGTLVSVSHRFKITLFTKVRISNPSIVIPLKIGYPPVVQPRRQQQQQQQPPPVPVAQASPFPATEAVPLPPPYAPTATAVPASSVGGGTTNNNYNNGIPMVWSVQQVSVRQLSHTTPELHQMANVITIPEDDTRVAPMATAPTEDMILGGAVEYYSNVAEVVDNEFALDEEEEGEIDIPAATTLSPPTSTSAPNIDSLLQEMVFSISDYDIISTKLRDPNWSLVLSQITAEQYGSILAHVNMDTDQPRVALLLAKHLGTKFNCDYGQSAAKNAAEWTRTTTVKEILPYCIDLQANHHKITAELSAWDQTVIRRDLDRVLNYGEA